mmetsp:Transcript_23739/g.76297  ORF Transcript_23739/g.76297 Transcript_23739/m.76297 type:complete len:239 (-) Transcript_23739:934-1650(-)
MDHSPGSGSVCGVGDGSSAPTRSIATNVTNSASAGTMNSRFMRKGGRKDVAAQPSPSSIAMAPMGLLATRRRGDWSYAGSGCSSSSGGRCSPVVTQLVPGVRLTSASSPAMEYTRTSVSSSVACTYARREATPTSSWNAGGTGRASWAAPQPGSLLPVALTTTETSDWTMAPEASKTEVAEPEKARGTPGKALCSEMTVDPLLSVTVPHAGSLTRSARTASAYTGRPAVVPAFETVTV